MTGNPRVVHVSLTDGNGGADIAAYRIFQATRGVGVASDMVVRESVRLHSDARVIPLPGLSGRFSDLLSEVAARLQKSDNPFHRSLNLIPTGGLDRGQRLSSDSRPDLVHLHWVGSNTLSLQEIEDIGVPIVWTLHDSWPFSGAEHHPLYPDDGRFQSGYTQSNRYRSSRVDVDRLIWQRKRRIWTRDFTLVAPSHWMQQQARTSALMGSQPTFVIPNPVPTDVFTADGPNLRATFGISPETTVLMFAGVGGARFTNKGWARLSQALEQVARSRESVHVLLVGADQRPPDLPAEIEFTGVGRIHDESSMAALYRSSDVLVTTSVIESFGLTAAEASACGIPVVCSGSTGLADVVLAGETGWWFDPEDEGSLIEVLRGAIGDPEERARRGAAGRARALRLWSMDVVGAEYARVYRSVLAGG